jgi:hypothetical protein
MQKLTKWQNVCPEKDTKEIPEINVKFIFKSMAFMSFSSPFKQTIVGRVSPLRGMATRLFKKYGIYEFLQTGSNKR